MASRLVKRVADMEAEQRRRNPQGMRVFVGYEDEPEAWTENGGGRVWTGFELSELAAQGVQVIRVLYVREWRTPAL